MTVKTENSLDIPYKVYFEQRLDARMLKAGFWES